MAHVPFELCRRLPMEEYQTHEVYVVRVDKVNRQQSCIEHNKGSQILRCDRHKSGYCRDQSPVHFFRRLTAICPAVGPNYVPLRVPYLDGMPPYRRHNTIPERRIKKKKIQLCIHIAGWKKVFIFFVLCQQKISSFFETKKM